MMRWRDAPSDAPGPPGPAGLGAAGVETNLLEMPWRCAARELSGSDDVAKPLHEYGIWDLDHFREKLLPQGTWARCTRCSFRTKSLNAATKGGAANSDAQQAQRTGLALRNRLAAAQARATCKQCQQTLDRGNFWPADWSHKNTYGVKCKTCEPREPGHRGPCT